MEMKVTPLHANGYESAEQWAMFHDTTGEQMSSAVLTTADSRYNGEFLSTLLIGGVATHPEYRRYGCVRRILESKLLNRRRKEAGWYRCCIPFLLLTIENSGMKKFRITGCWNFL